MCLCARLNSPNHDSASGGNPLNGWQWMSAASIFFGYTVGFLITMCIWFPWQAFNGSGGTNNLSNIIVDDELP
jgi:hypothetical protein